MGMDMKILETVPLRCANTKGFTYLEVLAAMLIMSIAIVPIIRLNAGAMTVASEIEHLTKVSFLAQNKIDEVRSRALGTNASYGFGVDYTESVAAFPSPDDSYKYTVADDDGTNIKVLNVTVWFDDDDDDVLDSDEESVSLDVKIANRGTWL